MRRKKLVLVLFIALKINFLGSCAYPSNTLQKQALVAVSEPEKDNFQNRLSVSIPLRRADNTLLHLQAEVTRPQKKIEPKTLVILVPGSGNVSRRGEIAGDGVDLYTTPIELYSLWAKNLSDNGFFVLSYDKRTCNPSFNILCKTNATKDIDENGIKALAKDLDQIYEFAAEKLASSTSSNEPSKIVLMTTTQGAQVIAEAACAKKAAGIVLLSPIAGNLESMWVSGLMKAHQQKTNLLSKNRLLNEAETTKSFFLNLKQNKFPENSQVRGASIKFWRSWLQSSANTIQALLATHKNILVLSSTQDVFSTVDNFKNKSNFLLKNIEKTDRNFISDGSLANKAKEEVVEFIKKLKE